MRLLAVETTTSIMSVALTNGARPMACYRRVSERTHTEVLMVAIHRLLEEAHVSLHELDGFAVAVGPGAFLALRVGIATVQGLAVGTGKRVVPVSSLEALALRALEYQPVSSLLKNLRPLQAAQKAPDARPQGPRRPERTRKVREDLRGTENEADGLFQRPVMICPMIDARRQEVYAARYRSDGCGGLTRVGDEVVMAPEEFFDSLTGQPLFLGDGAQLHRALIIKRFGVDALLAPADSPESAEPSATAVARLALERWPRGEAVDPAELLPVYLRPAVAAPVDHPA